MGGTGESASQSQRMHGAGYVGAIVGQVRRAEKNGKAGRAGTGGRSGNGLSRIFFWVLVGN